MTGLAQIHDFTQRTASLAMHCSRHRKHNQSSHQNSPTDPQMRSTCKKCDPHAKTLSTVLAAHRNVQAVICFVSVESNSEKTKLRIPPTVQRQSLCQTYSTPNRIWCKFFKLSKLSSMDSTSRMRRNPMWCVFKH